MTHHRARYGPHNPDETYIAHEFPERLVDLGEVQMNYATLGDESSPALMAMLAGEFRMVAMNFRGHGRSDHASGKYRIRDYSKDLQELVANVVRGPAIVARHSLGGLVAAFTAAAAPDLFQVGLPGGPRQSRFAQPSYASWRRHQMPVSFRPLGARSSHWYMPRARPVHAHTLTSESVRYARGTPKTLRPGA